MNTNQYVIQKFLALKDVKTARKCSMIYVAAITLVTSSCIYIGLLLFASFHDCDPLTTKHAKAKDQLMPLLVMNTLKDMPGLPGLFIAGIFSGEAASVKVSKFKHNFRSRTEFNVIGVQRHVSGGSRRLLQASVQKGGVRAAKRNNHAKYCRCTGTNFSHTGVCGSKLGIRAADVDESSSDLYGFAFRIVPDWNVHSMDRQASHFLWRNPGIDQHGLYSHNDTNRRGYRIAEVRNEKNVG